MKSSTQPGRPAATASSRLLMLGVLLAGTAVLSLQTLHQRQARAWEADRLQLELRQAQRQTAAAERALDLQSRLAEAAHQASAAQAALNQAAKPPVPEPVFATGPAGHLGMEIDVLRAPAGEALARNVTFAGAYGRRLAFRQADGPPLGFDVTEIHEADLDKLGLSVESALAAQAARDRDRARRAETARQQAAAREAARLARVRAETERLQAEAEALREAAARQAAAGTEALAAQASLLAAQAALQASGPTYVNTYPVQYHTVWNPWLWPAPRFGHPHGFHHGHGPRRGGLNVSWTDGNWAVSFGNTHPRHTQAFGQPRPGFNNRFQFLPPQ